MIPCRYKSEAISIEFRIQKLAKCGRGGLCGFAEADNITDYPFAALSAYFGTLYYLSDNDNDMEYISTLINEISKTIGNNNLNEIDIVPGERELKYIDNRDNKAALNSIVYHMERAYKRVLHDFS